MSRKYRPYYCFRCHEHLSEDEKRVTDDGLILCTECWEVRMMWEVTDGYTMYDDLYEDDWVFEANLQDFREAGM